MESVVALSTESLVTTSTLEPMELEAPRALPQARSAKTFSFCLACDLVSTRFFYASVIKEDSTFDLSRNDFKRNYTMIYFILCVLPATPRACQRAFYMNRVVLGFT